jgi:hypothetical protein
MARRFVLMGCALAGLSVNIWLAVSSQSTWNVDFNQYYSAGKLVGTGHLYDWNILRPLELERNSTAVPFSRIPANAVALKPLSALPYPVARAIWLCIGIAALGGFVMLWPFSSRAWAAVAVCWSAPVAMCLAFGQDSILFLFFAALGFRLLLAKRDFLAGLAFSACIAKPHLALLLPVFLFARRQWNVVLGGAAGGAFSLLVSFAAEGKDWPERMMGLARVPEFDPAPGRMPNLRGLLSFLGGSFGAEVGLGVLVAAAIWFLSRRQPVPVMAALILAGGLMLSHHAYFYDAPLLIPALLLPFQKNYPGWTRHWAFFLLTPIPYLFLLTEAGLPGQIAITGYTLTLIATSIILCRADGMEPESRLLPQCQG